MALEEREEGRGRVRQHCTTELPVSAGNLLSNASLFAPEPAPADELRVRSAPTAPRPVPGWGSHPSDQAPAGSESTSQQEAERSAHSCTCVNNKWLKCDQSSRMCSPCDTANDLSQ
jgi:hypothetical protein